MLLRTVLMGTGSFALPTFRTLIEGDQGVVAVVTQPERTGKGHHRHVNPVRELAAAAGIEVLQPERASAEGFLNRLRQLSPDVIIVAAYGQILKPQLLEIPRLGAWNLHGSLLPRHRGAAPVQYAIWCGDQQTGVTLFRIVPALDAGPVAATVTTVVGPRETAEQLMARLADLCVPLTIDFLNALETGMVKLTDQVDALATLAPRILKQDGIVDWNQPAHRIDCQVRAMQPWPKASTILQRPGHDDLRCILHDVIPLSEPQTRDRGDLPAGTISVEGGDLFVSCGRGSVQIRTIQLAGRRAMSAAEFVNGLLRPPLGRFA